MECHVRVLTDHLLYLGFFLLSGRSLEDEFPFGAVAQFCIHDVFIPHLADFNGKSLKILGCPWK